MCPLYSHLFCVSFLIVLSISLLSFPSLVTGDVIKFSSSSPDTHDLVIESLKSDFQARHLDGNQKYDNGKDHGLEKTSVNELVAIRYCVARLYKNYHHDITTIPVLGNSVLEFTPTGSVDYTDVIISANNYVVNHAQKVPEKTILYTLLKPVVTLKAKSRYVLEFNLKAATELSNYHPKEKDIIGLLYDTTGLGAFFSDPPVVTDSDENSNVYYPIGAVLSILAASTKDKVKYFLCEISASGKTSNTKVLSELTKQLEKDTKSKRSLAETSITPPEWICDPTYYGDGSCDCDCGTHDSDCNPGDTDILCSYPGECSQITGECPLPVNWTCSRDWYDSRDGCDCNCEGYDPDCDSPDQIVYGCSGNCTRSATNTSVCTSTVPNGWTCDDSYYDTFDGCDCGCGIPDPDCAQPRDYSTCTDDEYCENGVCVNINLPTSWECSVTSYNSSDACDCECGAEDPDCSDPLLDVVCYCPNMTCNSGICVGVCLGYEISVEPISNTSSPSDLAPSDLAPSDLAPSDLAPSDLAPPVVSPDPEPSDLMPSPLSTPTTPVKPPSDANKIMSAVTTVLVLGSVFGLLLG